jgi:6-pyruvoyltetrahydropterin/6-carboxytetrahydropterin synthase
MRGLGRYYQLQVRCAGEADPITGYFLNIKEIDAATREKVLPYLAQQVANKTQVALGHIMQEMIQRLQPPLNNTVGQVQFDLTPYYSLSIRSDDMSHVIMRQQFEFAAAHRLHVDTLSNEENRQIFGKCNNPSGHGHNYQLEVALRVPIDETGHVMAVEELDQLVDDIVIDKLDHKHLNKDVKQFKDLNPSVENITKVIWEMLAEEGAKESGESGGPGVELEEVNVWETGKTVCTYRG